MGFEHVPLDIPSTLEDTLHDEMTEGNIPDWLASTGLNRTKTPEDALKAGREMGGGVVARYQIMYDAPQSVHDAVNNFEHSPELESREGLFFRGFEVIVHFNNTNISEIEFAGVYQD